METEKITKDVNEKPLYLEPKFTSERWSDGIYNAETKQCTSSLYIKEDELLSSSQREEREVRNLIFKYQKIYAQKEQELREKEYREIYARNIGRWSSETDGSTSDSETDDSTSDSETEDKEPSSPPEKT